MACSKFVESLTADIDSVSSVADISLRLHERSSGTSYDDIKTYVIETIKILFIEGAVSELR
jgi:hypothetical protein